jgi:hypothetical protein
MIIRNFRGSDIFRNINTMKFSQVLSTLACAITVVAAAPHGGYKREALPSPDTSRPYLILYPSLEETKDIVKRAANPETSRPYLILYPRQVTALSSDPTH